MSTSRRGFPSPSRETRAPDRRLLRTNPAAAAGHGQASLLCCSGFLCVCHGAASLRKRQSRGGGGGQGPLQLQTVKPRLQGCGEEHDQQAM